MTEKKLLSASAVRRHESGFTLVELSVVLIVIAVLMGATMAGMNVYRQAAVQRMYSDFVLGWRSSYLAFVSSSFGVQPGDSTTAPTYAVGGGLNRPLCGDALIGAMLSRGIELPVGRSRETPDRYVYTDKSGAPHEIQICFETVSWTLPGTTAAVPQNVPRHVLRITGLTPSVANTFDSMTDGRVHASDGDFRQQGFEASMFSAINWSADERASMNNAEEGEAVELAAYLLVGR
ncbi:prepilin-type N-terminal cleavage/methylation domain-containing protein [Pseudacidovorax intermedius]|uniref:Prepilin-type N-terminal cleavage/methylation domain-containing protein n=1 Tax=Pseudacidovorax intermedius TaxID=433924 RepID=A0A370FA79_9BURK|nr:prepilin-type N-terminal cleavage/methylation domain-containing protein [Pseudacidovorax intermedius]RDI21888.1 prepilin-type N-terminal cleavage/methylation domain-containing protein [Pseudacidovorax intermedius]